MLINTNLTQPILCIILVKPKEKKTRQCIFALLICADEKGGILGIFVTKGVVTCTLQFFICNLSSNGVAKQVACDCDCTGKNCF